LKKLPKRNVLEHYFFNYYQVLFEVKKRIDDIIHSSPAKYVETRGGGVSHNSNPTELKAIKIAMDEELTEKQQWLKIVRDVVADMKYIDEKNKTKYAVLIQKRYFDELADNHVQKQLGLQYRSQYKEMKDVIFLEGIMLAIASGLIDYDDIRKFVRENW